ncbi:11569_t:CDS:2 [Dentiscutata heterogama]|uniref:11569_t:CDS:1 n=1 Tax=Dentiscutata heterogama TaxID=1316150 RepID=A0ACA9KVQ8_9GLOM|nr:11569_t:CDS:2 [Dentiscutata heterogama]
MAQPMEIEKDGYIKANEVGTASNGNNDLSSNTKNGSSPTSENNLGNNANEAKNGSSLTNDPNNSSNLSDEPNDGSILANDNVSGAQNYNGFSLASGNASEVAETPHDTIESQMNIDNEDEMKNEQSPKDEEGTTNQQDLKTSESEHQNDNNNSETQKTNQISEQVDDIVLLKGRIKEDEVELAEAYKKMSEIDKELDDVKKKNKEIESENHKLHQDNYNKEIALANLSNERNNLISRYNSLVRSFEELTKKNEELKVEAAHYQSKLGDAKNFKLGDDDPNNSTALTRDIEHLQDNINSYARVKKGVTLKLEAAKDALQQYGCSLENVANEDSEEKILIKWLLQRILIQNVTDMMGRYLKSNNSQLGPEGNRELELIHTTSKMTDLLGEFNKHRDGVDEVTQVAPIKLRQQIYAVLGDRGFADIKGEQKEHPFITHVSKHIDLLMSREIVKIFFFRLRVQEPEATFRWFKRGDKVDPIQMVGPWDENIDQWFVDICYFPLIGIDLDNENNRKILFQARVAVYKEKKVGFLNKLFNKSSTEDKRQQSRSQVRQSSTTSQSSQPSQPSSRQNSLNKNADPNLQGDPRNNPMTPLTSKSQHPQNQNASDNNRTAK